jgi:hypothetical protein
MFWMGGAADHTAAEVTIPGPYPGRDDLSPR